jgi:predicted phage tail protein
MPALPFNSSFQISTSPIAVEQIFTAGNIIEDSLQLQYIDIAQRTNFKALVSWRVTVENDLPTQSSALVEWADISENDSSATQQVFDLSDFCTNREQALRTARFLLSVRRRVTQTVTFKTVPDALSIQPGSYIRVMTTATTFNTNSVGAITDAGSLTSINPIDDGSYDAMFFNPTTGEFIERSFFVSGNVISDPSLHNTLFMIRSQQNNSSIFQVEQLTLDEEGLINVSAVQVPVDSSGASIVAKDVLTPGNFRVTE